MKIFLSFILSIYTLSFGVVYAGTVAVIGGGASGLVTAWLLEQDHEVTIYEAENQLGGHANSLPVKVDGATVMVDTGTEFFNDYSYPRFLKLLRYFSIPLHRYSMVNTFYRTDKPDVLMLPPVHDGQVEWKSFQAANWERMLLLKQILDRGHLLVQQRDTQPTLGEFTASLRASVAVKDDFLYPFLASDWGVSLADIQRFSAYDVLKYVVDSNDNGSNQWYEIDGGMKRYIDAVCQSFRSVSVRLNARVTRVIRNQDRYTVVDATGDQRVFDQVVFATDASVTSQLLRAMPGEEALAESLGKIHYYITKIAIHGDKRFMPPDPLDWRVINIRFDGKHAATTVYKSWKSKTPVFKSWITYDVRSPNDPGGAMPVPLYGLFTYWHPTVDSYYFEAQQAVLAAQGRDHLWFAGMWTYNNDSHESAIVSAMRVAEKLAPGSQRLKILDVASK